VLVAQQDNTIEYKLSERQKISQSDFDE